MPSANSGTQAGGVRIFPRWSVTRSQPTTLMFQFLPFRTVTSRIVMSRDRRISTDACERTGTR